MSAPAQPVQPAKAVEGAARVVSLVAVLVGILAIVFIVLGVVGLARTATPNMQGFNPGATVTVSSSGASVYARSDSDRMTTVCLLGEEGDATTLERPTSEFAVDVSGSDFYEVARVPASVAAGSYALTCEGTGQALYVGPAAPSTSASGLLGVAGLIGGIVLAFFALALGLIAVLMRTARAKGNADGGRYASVSSAAQPGYTSPYAAPPTGPSPPYGQQADHTHPAGQHPYAPSPTPGWHTAPSAPTQAMTYGQGHFDQGDVDRSTSAGDGPSSGEQSDHDHDDHHSHESGAPESTGSTPGDESREQDSPSGTSGQDPPEDRPPPFYPPPPPPR